MTGRGDVVYITKIVLRHARETCQNVSAPCYTSIIQTNKGQKMNKYELRENAVTLAKENYGTDKYAVLWGAASVLLTEKDLQIIINVLEKK